MDNQAQIQALLEKMEKNSRKQLFYSRMQFICTLALTFGCILILVKIGQFLPQLELLAAHAESVLINLETVTAELKKLDMVAMATSQTGVEEALASIQNIDFDTLNQAIEDLAAVVEPMANLLKRFSFGG